jgi:hypothetical protein
MGPGTLSADLRAQWLVPEQRARDPVRRRARSAGQPPPPAHTARRPTSRVARPGSKKPRLWPLATPGRAMRGPGPHPQPWLAPLLPKRAVRRAPQLPVPLRRLRGAAVRRGDRDAVPQPVLGPRRLRQRLLPLPHGLVRAGLRPQGGGPGGGAQGCVDGTRCSEGGAEGQRGRAERAAGRAACLRSSAARAAQACAWGGGEGGQDAAWGGGCGPLRARPALRTGAAVTAMCCTALAAPRPWLTGTAVTPWEAAKAEELGLLAASAPAAAPSVHRKRPLMCAAAASSQRCVAHITCMPVAAGRVP